MKFNDYYLGYLSKHRKLGTRMFHYIGIFMTFLFIYWCFRTNNFIYLPLAWFVVYPFAWFSHFVIEKNIPAAFRNPVLAKRSDFYMFFSELTNKLPKQMEQMEQIYGKK